MKITVQRNTFSVIVTTPGPQGASAAASGVTSFNGRTGAVTPSASDYSTLSALTITGTLTLTCPDDGTTHPITIKKVGSEYVIRAS